MNQFMQLSGNPPEKKKRPGADRAGRMLVVDLPQDIADRLTNICESYRTTKKNIVVAALQRELNRLENTVSPFSRA